MPSNNDKIFLVATSVAASFKGNRESSEEKKVKLLKEAIAPWSTNLTKDELEKARDLAQKMLDESKNTKDKDEEEDEDAKDDDKKNVILGTKKKTSDKPELEEGSEVPSLNDANQDDGPLPVCPCQLEDMEREYQDSAWYDVPKTAVNIPQQDYRFYDAQEFDRCGDAGPYVIGDLSGQATGREIGLQDGNQILYAIIIKPVENPDIQLANPRYFEKKLDSHLHHGCPFEDSMIDENKYYVVVPNHKMPLIEVEEVPGIERTGSIAPVTSPEEKLLKLPDILQRVAKAFLGIDEDTKRNDVRGAMIKAIESVEKALGKTFKIGKEAAAKTAAEKLSGIIPELQNYEEGVQMETKEPVEENIEPYKTDDIIKGAIPGYSSVIIEAVLNGLAKLNLMEKPFKALMKQPDNPEDIVYSLGRFSIGIYQNEDFQAALDSVSGILGVSLDEFQGKFKDLIEELVKLDEIVHTARGKGTPGWTSFFSYLISVRSKFESIRSDFQEAAKKWEKIIEMEDEENVMKQASEISDISQQVAKNKVIH